MRAHQIMTPQVITVGVDTTIVEAISTMLQHHISGLPVVDRAGKLIGIISEGDFICRAEIGTKRKHGRWLTFLAGADQIAAEFVHEHGRTVGEIMTLNPLTVTEDTPLDQIAALMESHGIKRLPVVRGDCLVGIVTRSDFLAAIADLSHDVAEPSRDDHDIRQQVMAAIEHTGWRPCRLNVSVRDGVVTLRGTVKGKNARKAATIAAENIAGVKKVRDHLCDARAYPPPEEDLGGGDFVSLQAQPSTVDDEPL
jgi:CBS domain-containing protein